MKTYLRHKFAFAKDHSFRLTVATIVLLSFFTILSGTVGNGFENGNNTYSLLNLNTISELPLLPVNGMTGHGNRPICGILSINATSLLQTDNSGKRQRRALKDSPSTGKDNENGSSNNTVCSATSLVDSGLGNQFTLVGAKPSGTS